MPQERLKSKEREAVREVSAEIDAVARGLARHRGGLEDHRCCSLCDSVATAFITAPGPSALCSDAVSRHRAGSERWAVEGAAEDAPMPIGRKSAAAAARRGHGRSRAELLKGLGLMGVGAALGLPRLVRAAEEQETFKAPMLIWDVLDQIKIELVGAKDEFAPLTEDEIAQLSAAINPPGSAKAYFGIGCYWGGEAIFRCTKGVVATRVGFMGGKQPNPDYENIKDHQECIEVTYVGGPATYERLLGVCGRTYDFVDIGHRYDRAIWAMDDSQRELAVQRRRAWSKMPVKDGAETFFTEAKLDHQAYSRPKCEASAAPNSALVAKGLKRIRDHFHYADDCPTCALQAEEEAV